MSLYPDHVVFLEGEIEYLVSGTSCPTGENGPLVLILPDMGILVHSRNKRFARGHGGLSGWRASKD